MWGETNMKLYFEDRYGERRVIATNITEEQVGIEIIKFIKKQNEGRAKPFKSYYTRSWTNEKGETVYDVGSWSEFFILGE